MAKDDDQILTIAGAGGHAKEIVDTLFNLGWSSESLFLFDNINESTGVSAIYGLSILTNSTLLREHLAKHPNYCLGVGGAEVRLKLYNIFEEYNGKLTRIIHPSSTISSAAVKETYDVLCHAFVSHGADIGLGSLINSGSQIHHDVTIGTFCQISPSCTILGHAHIGDYCNIGAGVVVLPGVQIGKGCVVGAGAVVTRNLPDFSLAYGVPAKIIDLMDSTRIN